ncbi:esterase [Frondihabitans sucicola]|uniref:Esterase n=1 Tax=Frondihabitans sucicola TaxID=1268041 RepID=A0ABM8GQV7_9MICO|nr:alpha/beta hydrolase [Frondihabitans sucicola]BDZ50840.1 esterase [Frondihabitans sucicola]
MPSIAARAVTAFLRASRANATFVSAARAREHIEDRSVRPPSFAPPKNLGGVDIRLDRTGGWPIYTVTPTTGAPVGALVYVHGGAWVNEIVSQHWTLIAQLATEADVTVIVPIYPLAPFGTSADVVEGVVDLFLTTRDEFGATLLAGDSAGGQISLSAAMILRDEHGVEAARTILISPAVDLSFENPDIPVVQPFDPWLAKPGGLVYADLWRGELAVTDPRVSPLFGDVTGLGPVALFSGTHDILNPDARLLVHRLREAHVDVDYFEGQQQVHVYPLLPTPEGRAARLDIVDQVRLATGI